jgi:hypothetical protein
VCKCICFAGTSLFTALGLLALHAGTVCQATHHIITESALERVSCAGSRGIQDENVCECVSVCLCAVLMRPSSSDLRRVVARHGSRVHVLLHRDT